MLLKSPPHFLPPVRTHGLGARVARHARAARDRGLGLVTGKSETMTAS
jgi:hypothetical protein